MAKSKGKPGRINGRQIKAARVLLNWKQAELAGAAGVPATYVRCVERGKLESHKVNDGLVEALNLAGVEFISDKRAKRIGVVFKEPVK